MTSEIHAALEQRDLLPAIHLVDTGYIDAELLVESEETYTIDLVGRVREDTHRQAREGNGFAAGDFTIDWTGQEATCPAGKTSIMWKPTMNKGMTPVINVQFSRRDCGDCIHRVQCTTARQRTLMLRPEERYRALQRARVRQTTAAFKKTYAQRAGIEGTISQSVRVTGLRQARYVGAKKTHLQHLATAAVNVLRVCDWLEERPRATTPQPQFERLYSKVA